MTNEAENKVLMDSDICKHTQSRHSDTICTLERDHQGSQDAGEYDFEEKTGDLGLFSLQKRKIRVFFLMYCSATAR